MNECTFVILGATGDLTKRKLIPALYRLIKHKKITKCALIGVALDETTGEDMLAAARKFIPKIDERVWKRLQRSSYYYSFNFYNEQNYDELKKSLSAIEKKHKLSGKRIFYLATMPQHFATITKNLARCGIVKREKTSSARWSRIIYEKPFGGDLMSARAINRNIRSVFDESQIYRIDHYLGKELVGNIALIRFTNRVFEPLWNNKHIDSVQIILSETIGIEGRSAFYNSTGALKDMVQSHMLQIMALVGMEAPEKLSGSFIRDAKAAVLKKIDVESAVFGQYEGYLQERGVDAASKTDTFVALKLSINNRRWEGVPFYLKTGKYLDKKEASIHIRFKMVDCLLNEKCPMDANYLTLRIFPDEGFYLELNAKVPGQSDITPVKMDFCHSCLFGFNSAAAYENLLLDVLRGDQSVFLRSDEIELSWKVIEKVEALKRTLYPYKKGSAGPKEIEKLDKLKPIRWRS